MGERIAVGTQKRIFIPGKMYYSIEINKFLAFEKQFCYKAEYRVAQPSL